MDMTTTSWIVAIIVFLISLYVAVKKEWNGFLFFICLIGFLPSLFFTWVLWRSKADLMLLAGLIALFFFVGMVRVLFRSRCPQCKKFFTSRKVGEELIQHGSVYYKGEKGSRQAYQKNLYCCSYVCKSCDHEWTRNASREERV